MITEDDGINTESSGNQPALQTGSDRVELYRSGLRKKWRWRYVAENGNIMADSGQSYVRRVDALHGAEVVTGRTFKPEYDELLSIGPTPTLLVLEVGR